MSVVLSTGVSLFRSCVLKQMEAQSEHSKVSYRCFVLVENIMLHLCKVNGGDSLP